MKALLSIFLSTILLFLPVASADAQESAPTLPADALKEAFQGRAGAFVLLDCSTGKASFSDAAACSEKLPPCSTFKVWNTAIGLELGIVKDPDAPFWKWDGVKRAIEPWNKDQTLRSGFAVSCVPAYQDLARQIGAERMREWIDKLGYGDRDMSAGIDVFWLPEAGRKTLLITPQEQTELIAKLVNGKMPFSARTLEVLESIMKVETTARGTLYGKTGTGSAVGWWIGYVESGGKTFAYACVLKGEDVMGKDARAAAESILRRIGML